MELFIGVDLAWAESGGRAPNETGVAALDASGRVVDCGWTLGVEDTVRWIGEVSGQAGALVFVDAPLVVDNETGQRACETEVGRRYGRWKVSANSTNLLSPRRAGVVLLDRLEQLGWEYDHGLGGPPTGGQVVSECYPYTTLVGAEEFGHPAERPAYKRKPRSLPTAGWRPIRAAACDRVIRAVAGLETADPPLLLRSHPESARLLDEHSPLGNAAYKHREDLLDALLCAWTAALWARHGFGRCQVLGAPEGRGRAATIIAPTRS
jgi:predicted RNase H-like nuclease